MLLQITLTRTCILEIGSKEDQSLEGPIRAENTSLEPQAAQEIEQQND
jgi:hypothetical protein